MRGKTVSRFLIGSDCVGLGSNRAQIYPSWHGYILHHLAGHSLAQKALMGECIGLVYTLYTDRHTRI